MGEKHSSRVGILREASIKEGIQEERVHQLLITLNKEINDSNDDTKDEENSSNHENIGVHPLK